MFRYYSCSRQEHGRDPAIRAEMHPMEAKLAGQVDCHRLHSAADAARAAEVFNAVVRRKKCRGHPPFRYRGRARGQRHPPRQALAKSAGGFGECAARKIKAGAVEINGEKVKDWRRQSRRRTGDPGRQELAKVTL